MKESDLEKLGFVKNDNGEWEKRSSKLLQRQRVGSEHRRVTSEPKYDPVPRQVETREEEKDHQGKCQIIITIHRTRAVDPDNHLVKWHIDAIKEAGLIVDDSPDHIELTVKYVKTKHFRDQYVSIRIVYPKGKPRQVDNS